jgi:hypothetical protein
MILGAIDPLEGSVLIVLASAMILSGVYIIERGSKTFKLNLYAFLMILAGTVVMFYLSFLGGVGGNTGISSWFMLFVLPYYLLFSFFFFRAFILAKSMGGIGRQGSGFL